MRAASCELPFDMTSDDILNHFFLLALRSPNANKAGGLLPLI